MSQTVLIEVPDLIAERFASRDELRGSVYEGFILSEFQRGYLSIRECATILGKSYEGFLEWLDDRGMPFILATTEELDNSYRDFEAFLQSASQR